jgi:hypothetical protein
VVVSTQDATLKDEDLGHHGRGRNWRQVTSRPVVWLVFTVVGSASSTRGKRCHVTKTAAEAAAGNQRGRRQPEPHPGPINR